MMMSTHLKRPSRIFIRQHRCQTRVAREKAWNAKSCLLSRVDQAFRIRGDDLDADRAVLQLRCRLLLWHER